MRVLFVSKEGDGLGVAQRLALEGHVADVWIADERFARAGRGIVSRVASWQAAARRADLIIADSVGLGKYEDVARSFRQPILGFSRSLDIIELDRAKGMELFSAANIDIPETFSFTGAKEATEIPEQQGWADGWVVKPSGNLSTSKTLLCKDPALWAQCCGALPPDCSGIVQRLVSGVEVSTEGWFNGTNFVRPFNHTFEEKKFLTGDLGQTTGCMGNVVIARDSNKLTKATVERVAPFLRHISYRGPFDINCIVNEHGAYALEATSRMGYDAVEALIEGLEEDAGTFLFEVATGTKKEMKISEEVMIAVRLSIPPWPVRKPDTSDEPVQLRGITDDNIWHLFLTDLFQKDGEYFTAGGDGVLLKATALGSINTRGKPDYSYEARRRVYRLLDKINVTNKQYRTDIGERVNGDLAKLKAWGWV